MQGHSHETISDARGHSRAVNNAPKTAHAAPQPPAQAHGHSHGGVVCHGHGAHDANAKAIEHHAPGQPVPLPPPHEAHAHAHSHSHAHSHDGKPCHGHGAAASDGGHAAAGKWQFDAAEWDNKPGVQEVSNHLINLLTSQSWWKPSLKTLDFGCGTSLNLRKLAKEHGLIDGTGADVEISMLVQLAKQIKSANLENQLTCKLLRSQEAEDLTGDYDLALTTTVFGHVRLSTVEKVMARLIASIRPGGHLMFCEFDNIDDVPGFGAKGGHAHGHGHSHGDDAAGAEKEGVFVSDGGHVHTNFTEESVRALLESNGMEVEIVDKFTAPISFMQGEDVKLMCLIARKPEKK